jgi:hypothetical protein
MLGNRNEAWLPKIIHYESMFDRHNHGHDGIHYGSMSIGEIIAMNRYNLDLRHNIHPLVRQPDA